MENRIDTLVLPVEPKASKPPVFKTTDTPWSMAARLGRYLLSGMDETQKEDFIVRLLEHVAGPDAVLDEPAETSVASEFAKCNKSRVLFMRGADGTWYAAGMGMFPKSRCGRHVWFWRSNRGTRETVFAFDVPTMAGALAVTDDMDIVERVVSRDKYHAGRVAGTFLMLAARRWTVEENLAANRRYAKTHSAGVFEDKLDFDDRHREAAEGSAFGRRFAHVELDNSVDLAEFHRLDREFDRLCDEGWLPAIGPDNSVRFRLCGRHRAIGVYSPTLKALAVDPRAPRSGAHEMAHAYDFEHGQLSAQSAFAPILDRQKAALSRMSLTDSRRAYYATPTEVFARAYELHLLDTGRASSLTSASVDALKDFDPSVGPLAHDMKAINEYFDGLGL